LARDVARTRGAALSHGVSRRVFDDESPHLDRFGSLLVLTILSVVALSLIDVESISNNLGRGVMSTLLALTTGVTLVLALRASGVTARWRRGVQIPVVLALVTSVIVLVIDVTTDADTVVWQSDSPSIFWVATAMLSPIAVIRRLIRHRTVSTSTMAGAIAAYLLIAVGFTYAFVYVDGVRDTGFFEGAASVPSYDFMYFSLVSITTVGYGDLTPDGPLPQLLATSEAVIGQVYLVTFVAMLVGLLIQQRDQAGSATDDAERTLDDD